MLRLRKHKNLDARALNLRTGRKQLIVHGDIDPDTGEEIDPEDEEEAEADVPVAEPEKPVDDNGVVTFTPEQELQIQDDLTELHRLQSMPAEKLTVKDIKRREDLAEQYQDMISRTVSAPYDDDALVENDPDKVEEDTISYDAGTSPVLEERSKSTEEREAEKLQSSHDQNMI